MTQLTHANKTPRGHPLTLLRLRLRLRLLLARPPARRPRHLLLISVTDIYARLLDTLPFIGVLAVPESVTKINYSSDAGTTPSLLAGSTDASNPGVASPFTSLLQLTQRALCTTRVATETADAIAGELANSDSTDCPDGKFPPHTRRAAKLTATWSPDPTTLYDDIDAYYLTASDAGIVRASRRPIADESSAWLLGARDAELHRNLTQAAAELRGRFMLNLGEGVQTTDSESVQGIWIGAAMDTSIGPTGLPATRPVLAARMNAAWDPLASCNSVSHPGETVRCYIIDADADLYGNFDIILGHL